MQYRERSQLQGIETEIQGGEADHFVGASHCNVLKSEGWLVSQSLDERLKAVISRYWVVVEVDDIVLHEAFELVYLR